MPLAMTGVAEYSRMLCSARSRQGLLQGGFGRVVAADGAEVFRRILQPVWSTALASGRKWVEVQKYTCATSRNAMKCASAGKIIRLVPPAPPSGRFMALLFWLVRLPWASRCRRPCAAHQKSVVTCMKSFISTWKADRSLTQ